jgi:hypothetical protein
MFTASGGKCRSLVTASLELLCLDNVPYSVMIMHEHRIPYWVRNVMSLLGSLSAEAFVALRLLLLLTCLLVLILARAQVLLEIKLGQSPLASGRTWSAALSRKWDAEALLNNLNFAS